MNAVADSMLLDRDPWRKLGAGHQAARKIFLQCHPLVHMNPEVLGAEAARHKFHDRANALVHSQAEHLHRERVVEPIGDQARKPVAFRVDHAIGIALLVDSQGLDAELHRPGDLVVPERGARSFLLA